MTVGDALWAQLHATGLQVGRPFEGPQLYWSKDSLNRFKVTSVVGRKPRAKSLKFSIADASVLKVGYILRDGGDPYEEVQIRAIYRQRAWLTKPLRGAHPFGTIWRVVNWESPE